MRNWFPRLIQGGMGIGVSLSELAQSVSKSDPRALGVVSLVAIREVFVRYLQLGDLDGKYRRALKHFPGDPQIVADVLKKFFKPDGLKPGEDFLSTPAHSDKPTKLCLDLDVLASFCEVWSAGHPIGGNVVDVGVNHLEKHQTAVAPLLFGSMLGGAGFVLMGAGVTSQIPNLLTKLSRFQAVEYRIHVSGLAEDKSFVVRFDPKLYLPNRKRLKRPKFLAIVSSYALAKMSQKWGADGLVVENGTAGGHNAPPRGKQVNPDGSPKYDERDEIDWEKVQRDIPIPYYLAGSYATRADRWEFAKSVGAYGIQTGSIFALSDESNITEELKSKLRKSGFNDTQRVRRDGRFSSSGYPFMIAEAAGTLSDPKILEARERRCNLCFLRTAHKREDGSLVWRCPSEPIDSYLKKGGEIEDCKGRGCLCNALLATIGLGGIGELPVVTLGEDLGFLKNIMDYETDHYTAKKAVDYLLNGID